MIGEIPRVLSSREMARRLFDALIATERPDEGPLVIDLRGSAAVLPSFFDEMLRILDESRPGQARTRGLIVRGMPRELSESHRAIARFHGLEIAADVADWHLTGRLRVNEVREKLALVREFQMKDLRRSIFYARTNFLTALGLVTYTEFWGYFLIDDQDHQKVRQAFEAFLRFMGDPYGPLLQREPDLYDILRCGLIHEYGPKRVRYTILGEDRLLSDERIRAERPAGLALEDGYLILVNARYYVDLKDAVDRLIADVPDHLETVERRLKQINLGSFR